MLIVTMVNYDGREELVSIRKKAKDEIALDLTNISGWMMQFSKLYLEYVKHFGDVSIKVLYVFEDGSNRVFQREYYGYTFIRSFRFGNRFSLDYRDVRTKDKYVELDEEIAKIISDDIYLVYKNPKLGEDIWCDLFKDTKYDTRINLFGYTNPRRWPTVMLIPKCGNNK